MHERRSQEVSLHDICQYKSTLMLDMTAHVIMHLLGSKLLVPLFVIFVCLSSQYHVHNMCQVLLRSMHHKTKGLTVRGA